MARYIKFEDAINAIKQYAIDAYSIDLECTEQFAGSRPEERFCEGLFEAIEALDEVHTADVGEIVRCCDCKYSRKRNEYEQRYLVEGVLICTSGEAADECWNPVYPSHFCSYGERRG